MIDEDIIKNKKAILRNHDESAGRKSLDSTHIKHKRRQRHDSDSDNSLPRKRRHDSDSDESLPRRGRHDSDSDQSLPRKGRHDSDSDQSLPRKGRHDSDSDQSLPRKQRQNSDSDVSPPRRKGLNSGSNKGPSRKRKNSDSDISPPRRNNVNSDSDESPPRRKQDSHSKKDKMDKTLSGKKAGLSSAKDMKIEAEKLKQKESEAFKKVWCPSICSLDIRICLKMFNIKWFTMHTHMYLELIFFGTFPTLF